MLSTPNYSSSCRLGKYSALALRHYWIQPTISKLQYKNVLAMLCQLMQIQCNAMPSSKVLDQQKLKHHSSSNSLQYPSAKHSSWLYLAICPSPLFSNETYNCSFHLIAHDGFQWFDQSACRIAVLHTAYGH
jgi:hypothetical protein